MSEIVQKLNSGKPNGAEDFIFTESQRRSNDLVI